MHAAVMACWWRRITPSPRPQESRGASRLTGLSQRREAAIEQALRAKIEQRRAAREAQDGNGSLTKTEIVDAVTSAKKVISFLGSCGEPNLQFLLQPKRLEKALKVLDTSQDGEIDADEWCVFRVRKIRVASTAWSWCRAHPDAIAATAHRSLHRAGRRRSTEG